MAWMLCEEFVKAAVAFIAGWMVTKLWKVVMREIQQCMIPGCYGVASRRGLCLKCYGKAKKKVDAGETTWEKLEEKELCKKSASDPFDSAYEKAMEND